MKKNNLLLFVQYGSEHVMFWRQLDVIGMQTIINSLKVIVVLLK